MATPVAPSSGTNGKRSPAVFILPIVVLAFLAWGAKSWLYNRSHVNTDNAQVDGSIVPVLAKVGGFITAVRVVENQTVKAGDTLVAIDDAEYAARLAQADAELSAASFVAGRNGVMGQAQAQIQSANSQEQVVEAQIQSARAAQQKATADLARTRELVDKQIVSKQQLDAMNAAFEQASANLVAMQRQAGAATAQVSNAEIGSKFALARYASARAARENAALQLSYARVVAPVSGAVSRKQIEPGQLVQPGQPLLTLVADSNVWVTANFKETQLSDLRVGQRAELEVDSYPGCTAEGTVQSLGAATGAKFALLPPDNSTGNFTKVVQRLPVRIAVTKGCGSTLPLRPGMSVTAHVSTK